MALAYAGPERRSGTDRRIAHRRRNQRSAADTWRRHDRTERRSGRDRRSGSERRRAFTVARAHPPLADLALAPSVDNDAIVVDRILEQRQLDVVYQPIYELKTGRVFAYEALARTDAPEFTNLLDLFRAEIDQFGVRQFTEQQVVQHLSPMCSPELLHGFQFE